MQTVVNKKTHRASGLLIALIASTMILSGCGEGLFFDSEGPTTTAAATDNGNTTAAPTTTPTPSATATPGTEPVTTPAPGAAPAPAPSPGAAPAPAPTPTPTPTPTPAPTPSAGSIGKTLWAKNCQSCHGGNTSKGASASKTLTAIKNNVGNMGFLSSSIGPTQASQIATYAANPGAY